MARDGLSNTSQHPFNESSSPPSPTSAVNMTDVLLGRGRLAFSPPRKNTRRITSPSVLFAEQLLQPALVGCRRVAWRRRRGACLPCCFSATTAICARHIAEHLIHMRTTPRPGGLMARRAFDSCTHWGIPWLLRVVSEWSSDETSGERNVMRAS